jgi:phosphohistidine phosphatase SixA
LLYSRKTRSVHTTTYFLNSISVASQNCMPSTFYCEIGTDCLNIARDSDKTIASLVSHPNEIAELILNATKGKTS